MSKLVDIAESLRTSLAGAGIMFDSQAVTVERKWLPYLRRESIGDQPRIVVVPNNHTREAATRGKGRSIVEVDVFVQADVDWEDNADADAVSDLAEDVADEIQGLSSIVTEGVNASLLEPTFDPAVVGEHLAELRIFT